VKILRSKWLYIGDIVTLGVVTAYGFASHGTLGSAGMRLLTTFIPLLVAWFLLAPFLGVYQNDYRDDWCALWRPFMAMVLGAPWAAFLRAVLLGTTITPLFVVILGGVSALAIVFWRGLAVIVFRRLN